MKNTQRNLNFSGDYTRITFYYATLYDIEGYNTQIQMIGEDPYSIEIGITPILLIVVSTLLVIYIVVSSIQCCTKSSEMSRRSIWEYKQYEWSKNSNFRIKNILKSCPESLFQSDTGKYIQKSCTVCLGEFTENEPIRKLMCSHIYHANCIESWIKAKINEIPKCPVCNTILTKLKPPSSESDISFNMSVEVNDNN